MLVHGGAGPRRPDDGQSADRLAALRAALQAGAAQLEAGALSACIAAVCVLEDEPLFNAGLGAVLAQACHVSNYYIVHAGWWNGRAPGTWVYWSLAVEEQFYITWPFLIFLLKKRTLIIVLFSLFVVSLSLRLAFYFRGAESGFVHQYTFSRLDAITFGSLAALWLRSPSCTLLRWRKCSYWFLFIGTAGTVLARILMHRNSSIVGYTFLGVMYTGLIGVLLISGTPSSLLGRSFSARWLRYMGRISYGIYLLHYPLFIFWARFINSGNLFPSNPVARNLLAFGGQILIATVAGSISWYFFEEPILRLKERFPSGSAMHSRTEAEESKPWNRAVVTDSRA